METRLAGALRSETENRAVERRSATVSTVTPPKADEPEADAMAATAPEPATAGELAPSEDQTPWPIDETAEAAFRADARSRGEVLTAPAETEEAAEEIESKGSLPPLHDLVQRIPAEVRETLEELFRAKFVGVKRVPKKALKG